MAEIWPNLLPHKTFRADASLRQRLDSGHFLLPPQVKSESSFFFRLGTNAPYLATAKEMRGLPSLCL